ncbi:MAG: TiaS agmantine-binding domain-containing protein [Thermoplasmata archaeon]
MALDDTDSPRGGCTTYVLTEVIRAARDLGHDLIGLPRLVRLNPNVPWKTRGNAALAARFGRGVGPRQLVGRLEGRPVWSYRGGRRLSDPDAFRLRAAAWAQVVAHSRIGEPDTDPAMVASECRPPADLYYRAVRTVVDRTEVEPELAAIGAEARTLGSRRGVVGAAAALAWPGRRVTFELIAYRHPERWGSPRQVDPREVRSVAARHPELFLCYDRRTRRLLVAPHTACPILYGLRSTDLRAARRAHRELRRTEPWERWLLFVTNQGTGDHLRPGTFADLGPFESARVVGTLAADPVARRGGHVEFPLTDDRGASRTCLAFEPTKTLPKAAQRLRRGDRVRIWGSRGASETVRLEGLELLRRSSSRAAKVRPPTCPICQRQMHSLGRGRGFRCDRCRARRPPESARPVASPAPFPRGPVHPTPSARRHLAPRGPEP